MKTRMSVFSHSESLELDVTYMFAYNFNHHSFLRAKKELDENLIVTGDWNEFCNALDKKKLIQTPFCGDPDCEDKIKKDSARWA